MNDEFDEFDRLAMLEENRDAKRPGVADIWLRTYVLPLLICVALFFICGGIIIKLNANAKVAAYLNPPLVYSEDSASSTSTPNNSASVVSTPESTAPISNKGTIVLDAGHGGSDPGTQGTQSGIKEQAINLSIAQKLEQLLIDGGYNVIMTRNDENALADTKEGDMQAREHIIISSNADIFVSIHQNAFTDSNGVSGPEVYYNPASTVASTLATCIQTSMDSELEIAKSRGVKTAGHRLTKPLPYSVLVECGYMTSASEEMLLIAESYQQRVAQAIFDGVDNFFATFYQKS